MFPADFDYHRPEGLDDAIWLLHQHGDEVKLLAGGQSLLPLMKFRLATPEALVDIGRVPELRGVTEHDDTLLIAPTTSHQDVLDSALLRERCGALAEVVRRIGDPQVRHRGTIGGALAHGDAAGDLPALARALDAEFSLASQTRRRRVPAADFFTGHLETVIAPDELLVGVRVPVLDGTWSWAYEKFAPVSHAWAVVGACALVRRLDGRIAEARIGLTNMGDVPLRATATEAALVGAEPVAAAVAAAAAHADRGTTPPSDLNADSDYRRHLARVLTARALARALRLDPDDPEVLP